MDLGLSISYTPTHPGNFSLPDPMAMIRPLGLILLCSLGLVSCVGSAPPRRPLMSPLSEARTFGYSERTVARDEIEVTYLGRARFVSLIRNDRRRDTAIARKQAEELALWRGAQVALARKAKAFQVLNRRSNVDVEIRDHHYGYGFPPPYRHRNYRYRRHGFFGGHAYYPYGPSLQAAYAQAKATLTIALLARMRKGALNAKAVDARLRQKYAKPGP